MRDMQGEPHYINTFGRWLLELNEDENTINKQLFNSSMGTIVSLEMTVLISYDSEDSNNYDNIIVMSDFLNNFPHPVLTFHPFYAPNI